MTPTEQDGELRDMQGLTLRDRLRHLTDGALESYHYDELEAFITQYGNTRERKGIDRVLNLLKANLALCGWSNDISARKLWKNMREIYRHGESEEKL